LSDHAFFGETVVMTPWNDDVVDQLYSDDFARFAQSMGYLNVLLAGG
tara:strand:+ start:258 stop:398 length:141 start_codon:yes stop_codon:yes gene_type:complete